MQKTQRREANLELYLTGAIFGLKKLRSGSTVLRERDALRGEMVIGSFFFIFLRRFFVETQTRWKAEEK